MNSWKNAVIAWWELITAEYETSVVISHWKFYREINGNKNWE